MKFVFSNSRISVVHQRFETTVFLSAERIGDWTVWFSVREEEGEMVEKGGGSGGSAPIAASVLLIFSQIGCLVTV